jgi:hypothetical protein
MRRFERCSKLTHQRIRIGQPQGCALARSASDDAHLAGSWPVRPSSTFQCRSAPLPGLSADCHRRRAPAANPESVRRARCRTQLSAERLVTSQGWLPASAGSGAGLHSSPQAMAPSGVGAGIMAWLPKTALRDPLGRVPSALWIGALPLYGSDGAPFWRRGSALVRRISRPLLTWVGSCETHLKGHRSCSIRTNRCSSP